MRCCGLHLQINPRALCPQMGSKPQRIVRQEFGFAHQNKRSLRQGRRPPTAQNLAGIVKSGRAAMLWHQTIVRGNKCGTAGKGNPAHQTPVRPMRSDNIATAMGIQNHLPRTTRFWHQPLQCRGPRLPKGPQTAGPPKGQQCRQNPQRNPRTLFRCDWHGFRNHRIAARKKPQAYAPRPRFVSITCQIRSAVLVPSNRSNS